MGSDLMSAEASVLLEARDGHVAILTLNAPEKRNALVPPMRVALAAALDRIEADPSVRAVILTGGEKVFSAGGDLTAMRADGLAGGRERFRLMHGVVRSIVKSSKPFIAAVEGWAAGAGFSLALCCDTIIAGADARFVAAFPKMGLVADAGLLLTLPARVGAGRAKQILLYAKPIDAAAAHGIGLVDEVVPSGTALARALDCAREVDAVAPLPTAFAKDYLARGIDEVLDWERSIQAALYQTTDHAEGKAAFLEKRRPTFQGQ
jgi:enoyl-CoA hydratase/carnithine racemase